MLEGALITMAGPTAALLIVASSLVLPRLDRAPANRKRGER
ncbi:MAG: hypothetical protein QNJ35_12680 [Paracoccaceae bacterium]|nr:hypothetical protein [Paracoccaceae bacterium]